jgi:hypothetical protein
MGRKMQGMYSESCWRTPLGKGPLRRPRRWKYSIMMDFREVTCEKRR